jgi:uncharacterized membrane protein
MMLLIILKIYWAYFWVNQMFLYPFILLNLAFSLQAAYAAPLILLAQTRQADRDRVHTEADAKHREELAAASEQRALILQEQTEKIISLITINTALTETTKQLSEQIAKLTTEVHAKFILSPPPA